nr:hypothetical protein [Tanacetum cinerariifolium]
MGKNKMGLLLMWQHLLKTSVRSQSIAKQVFLVKKDLKTLTCTLNDFDGHVCCSGSCFPCCGIMQQSCTSGTTIRKIQGNEQDLLPAQ